MTDLGKISDYLLRIEDRKEMMTFLNGVLTASERKAIARRIRIVEMLKEGLAQRKIAKKLGVGIATVTRGAKEVHDNKFETSLWRDFGRWRDD